MIEISAAGLKRRATEDAIGMTEEGFLLPLRALIERGFTRAEELLQRYRNDWRGDLAPLFDEYNFL
jgi:glutamate--cysteine ligase